MDNYKPSEKALRLRLINSEVILTSEGAQLL